VLFGVPEGKHLVQGVGEVLQANLRGIGRHQVLNDIDQTLDLHVCPQAPHGIRRQVVFELGFLGGMNEQRVINQQAQDHAVACAFFAGLLGQQRPSFMPLPVLHKNLDEPPQRVALDHIKRAPSQIRGHQIAIGLFLFVFDRYDEPFSLVRADV
jgi:hypothetical protein